ncbi:MAG: hypothetical protein ACE5RJ_05685 [Nitrosopumilaceae archaeon]
MTQTLKLVFSNHRYVILAGIISVGLFIPLIVISEYIFVEPYFVIHIPIDRLFGFLLIVAVSILSGIVLAMNVFRIKMLNSKTRKIGGGLLGSIIGASAGACSCGPIGFAVISTFGVIGGTATAFLANYEIPLRLAALAILGLTYYTTSKSLSFECRIKN